MTSLIRETRAFGLREALLGGTGLRNVGRLEGFFLRLLFAVVVWRSLEFYPAYPSAPKPVGLAALPALWEWLGWEITRLSDPALWAQCLTWVKVALCFYVLGYGLPVALPVITLVHVAIRTLNNSQGAAHHGFQMVSLALLTQTLVVWFLALVRGWIFVRKQAMPRWAAPGNWTWLWVYTIAIAAASYIISVCSKLDESRGQWLKNPPCVAIQIVKTYRQNYYNSLNPQFIQASRPPPRWMPIPPLNVIATRFLRTPNGWAGILTWPAFSLGQVFSWKCSSSSPSLIAALPFSSVSDW